MIPIRQAMETLMADEGWMTVGDDAVAAVIRAVEDRFPEGSTLDEATFARLRRTLRLLGEWVSAGATFPDLPGAAVDAADAALS